MNLNQWAIKHGVTGAALYELRQMFGTTSPDNPPIVTGESEAAVQTRVRLEATRKGLRLWRNNVGGTYTDEGSFLRYGLANDSKQMNKVIKSSDLIGIRPVQIGSRTIGQFVAREVKPQGWHYTGTERERAQLKFLELVTSMGGDAAFTDREGSL